MVRSLLIQTSGALAVGLMLAATGCERSDTNAPGGNANPDLAMIALDKNAPLPTALSVDLLATLAPARPTVLAATPDGSIYIAQAPAAGDGHNGNGDVLVIRPDGHAAEPTALTAAAVIHALNLAPKAPAGASPATTTTASGVTGQFTAIAARGDGKLAFAFGGIADKRPFFALGTFDPSAPAGASSALFLPVDHLTVAAAGDAEVATDAARQNLFTAGDDAWLWRATDKEMRLVAVHNLSDAEPKLSTKRLALDHVRDAAAAPDPAHTGPDAIQRSGWEWSATPERGHFLLTDRASRWIRRIDDDGNVSHVARFEADTVASLSAATQDAAGRVIVFGCDRDGIARALLVQDGATFKSLPAGTFTTPLQLPASRLQIDRLLPIPKQPNTFAAYDGTSGAVVRVTLK